MTPAEKKKSYKESIAHCDAWDRMYKKYGAFKLAKKIMRLESYRKYKQRWPFDFSEPVVHLDDIEIINSEPSVEELVGVRLELEKMESELTPMQKEVFSELMEGKTNSQIEADMGFNTNNAVRWHKHQIKKKYQSIKQSEVKEYICRSCAWIYKDRSALECPKCGSRDIFKISLG